MERVQVAASAEMYFIGLEVKQRIALLNSVIRGCALRWRAPEGLCYARTQ